MELKTKFGNIAKNQRIETTGDMIKFISHNSLICCYNEKDKKLLLNGKLWNYGNTTRFYFKQFINRFTSFDYDNKKSFMKALNTDDAIEIVSVPNKVLLNEVLSCK